MKASCCALHDFRVLAISSKSKTLRVSLMPEGRNDFQIEPHLPRQQTTVMPLTISPSSRLKGFGFRGVPSAPVHESSLASIAGVRGRRLPASQIGSFVRAHASRSRADAPPPHTELLDRHTSLEQFDGVLKCALQQLRRQIQRRDAAAPRHARHHAIADEVEHVNQVHVGRNAVGHC